MILKHQSRGRAIDWARFQRSGGSYKWESGSKFDFGRRATKNAWL